MLQLRAEIQTAMVWCARDLFGSQSPATTGNFPLCISCIGSRYISRYIRPNSLGGFGVAKFATLRQ